MGRSSGFSLGGSYSSHRQHQQWQASSVGGSGVSFGATNNQDLHICMVLIYSHLLMQTITRSGTPNIGLIPVNSPNSVSGMGSYDQHIQKYQQLQGQFQFCLQQMSAVGQSYRDQNLKAMQAVSDRDLVSGIQKNKGLMGRSSGFSLGGSYSSHRRDQQHQASSVGGDGVSFGATNNQDLLHMDGSDLFPSFHANYHPQVQNNGPPNVGLRPVNSPNSVSSMGSYDHLIQQYQQLQSQRRFRLQQMSAVDQSYRDQNLKTMQTVSNRFALLGLLGVIKMSNPNLNSLTLGTDLTTLGLNLSSTNDIHKKFASPWSEESAMVEHKYTVPECYYDKFPPPVHQGYFSKFQPETLFYIFYSMPKDEAQLYAANELHNRGWFYHREFRLWLIRVSNMEPSVKTNTCETGSYLCFDPNTWETVRKDNFVLYYEMLEKRPVLLQQH
ncbi:hypothetical protein NE237_028221 [Protea cynaroides]|uniref:NOT2/NOT3/NOT5 C-terminal domain-containing protein n=1 Tax=Protea cynaroides TaxID=273540 RepID=A0A9Q0GPZ0_9MAGN|nr:hypothetical protein NE237_028221 [Protea cynaroides]